ncbi:MAG: GrpB family protein [Clostridia bacterium]|nr:GrpB family protein [Clostridia bacterium]MBR2634857.1 GrpB family protein [Clostridia bacterium]
MSQAKRETVRLMSYTPEWAETGALVKRELLSVLGNRAIEIAHVGSTAIPGMKARPIIDIAVGVRSFEHIPELYGELAVLGYNHRGDTNSDSQIFLTALKNRYNVYIHIVIHGKTLWNSYVVFCDCLKKDAETRQKYEQLKISLATRFAFDRRSYTAGKSEFVRRTLRLKGDIKERSCGAVVWRKRGGRRHYLIIQNRSGHNGFPKGHMEYGESEAQTALREIREETSLEVTLDTSFRAEYRYLVDGYIHKSALYFLASYTDGNFKPQKGEVYGIWLLPYEEALEQLDYEQDRRILRQAEKRLADAEAKSKK